jgi:hypothetical protein
MKKLLVLLLSVISLSSFASVVTCDIYKRGEDSNFEKIDTKKLGDVGPGQYLQESGSEIKGIEGKFINIAISTVSNNTFANIEILEGGPNRIAANKLLLNVQGATRDGLTAYAGEEKISFFCKSDK